MQCNSAVKKINFCFDVCGMAFMSETLPYFEYL